jgi:predicted short-subunit dehydrogenase-like oxidoreductase (DUF2520 family)
MQKPSLGFIGAGKVGHTLARLWYAKGYKVRAVYSRTTHHAGALAEQVDAEVVSSAAAVVQMADLTLLTVPDHAIADLSDLIGAALTQEGFDGSGKAVVHTSGAFGAEVLSHLTHLGFMTGSLHPAFPFADVETSMERLPGATFGIEMADVRLNGWLRELVRALDGRVFIIPAGGKAVYHSALVFASNYTVTLYAVAEGLLVGLGADQQTADNALNSLMMGSIENLRLQGVPTALTGPLVRGDWQTIRLHLDALAGIDNHLAGLYQELAQLSIPMLAARGIDTAFLEQLLNSNREQHHASDHS